MGDKLSMDKLKNTVGRRYDLFSGGYVPPQVNLGDRIKSIFMARGPQAEAPVDQGSYGPSGDVPASPAQPWQAQPQASVDPAALQQIWQGLPMGMKMQWDGSFQKFAQAMQDYPDTMKGFQGAPAPLQ